MFVKPAPGLKVRDPVTRALLPETGKDVPANMFWLRRLRDKDVIAAEPPAPAPASIAAPAEHGA